MKYIIALVLVVVVASASAGRYQHAVPVRNMPAPASILPNGRITNGQTAAKGQFPHQAGLSFSSKSGSWWCGGSLIASQWVLTAAHCTNGATSVTVNLGATERTKPALQLTSTQFFQHADYSSIILRNDISLIKISAVKETELIKPIPLPSDSERSKTFAGEVATASGWGKLSDTATGVAPNLQYVDLNIIENAKCAETFGSLIVGNGVICVSTTGGTSTCNGDSGGPLVLKNKHYLVGVTSFGSSSGCTIGAPAGFTRVTYYLDWINNIVNNN